MALPKFTATKGAKSATFRIFDLVRDLQPEDDEGNPAPLLLLDVDLLANDPWGDDTYWSRDRSHWPDQIVLADFSFGLAQEAAAVSALGSELDGKPEAKRQVMIAVKAFDQANGCTSVIDWGT